jgi:putative PIN family toxin of toxin-antitoxin system
MNIKAVIDTNVLVSAYLTRNSDSPPARVYRAMFSGTVTALVNDEIISEYKDVLHRPKFGFNADDIDKDVAFIEQSGVKINPADSAVDFPDPDDKVFFCTALAGAANLVTGNMKHYPIRSYIVTPREMIEIINKEDQAIKNLNNS